MGGLKCAHSKTRHAQRMAWHTNDGPEAVLCKLRPVIYERLNQPPPCAAVGAKRALRIIEIALKHNGGAIVERMRERRIAINPFKAIIAKRQRGKEW
jgi:hypothetical protein